jgi:hypothetical protein
MLRWWSKGNALTGQALQDEAVGQRAPCIESEDRRLWRSFCQLNLSHVSVLAS